MRRDPRSRRARRSPAQHGGRPRAAPEALSPLAQRIMEYVVAAPDVLLPLPWLQVLISRHHPDLAAERVGDQADPFDAAFHTLFASRLLVADQIGAATALLPRHVRDYTVRRFGGLRDERLTAILAVAQERVAELAADWPPPEARAEADCLLSLARHLLAEEDPRGAPFGVSLSRLLLCLDRADQRAELVRRAFAVQQRVAPPSSLERVDVNAEMAMVELHEGRSDRARQLLDEAIALVEGAAEPDSKRLVHLLDLRAGVEQDAGNRDAAVDVARRALALAEEVCEPRDLLLLRTCSNLGWYLEAAHRIDEAIPYYRQAFAGYLASNGWDHNDTDALADWLWEHDPEFESWAQEQGIDLSFVDEEDAGDPAPPQ